MAVETTPVVFLAALSVLNRYFNLRVILLLVGTCFDKIGLVLKK
jgi:hypothetical protein